MKKKKLASIKFIFILLVSLLILFNPLKTYTDADFQIPTYHSHYDKDQDGIDDQSDILQSAKAYVSTRPKYKSVYYNGGFPNDEYGVCSDVVAFALLRSGYNLMDMVNTHIQNNRHLYSIDVFDPNIEFRRVFHLKVFFDNTALLLPCDISEIEQWQAGDIVIFQAKEGHIAIISDKRNKNGVPYVIHHAHPFQLFYEEDILEDRDDIIGHYRLN